MCFKKIITLVIIAMFAFLFVSKPIMQNSVVYAADSEALECEDMLDGGLDEILDSAYLIMQVAAIALTVVMGMLDFGKAISSSDQDLLKKASKKFVKRLIAMVVIIILPYIIDPIVEVALGSGYDTCGVGE